MADERPPLGDALRMIHSVSRGSAVDPRQSFLRTAFEMRSGTPTDSPMTLADVMSDPGLRELRTPALGVGERAFDFSLRRFDDPTQRVQLSQFEAETPVALVFGSYTCPPFRAGLASVQEVYRRHRERVAFFMIYIREAHPEEGWVLARNRRLGIVIADPTSFEERAKVARSCAEQMKLEMPVLVDEPGNEVASHYGGWPIRLYLIDRDGRVVYQGADGPFGFKPAELEAAIHVELGREARA
jgi:hypothetical protein